MRRIPAIAIVLALGAPSCTPGDDVLLVFAAASLADAFDAVEIAFEAAHPQIDAQMSYAGSSALRNQILEGAPADVFASADAANMAPVLAAIGGSAVAHPFARNDMVIGVPAGNPGNVFGLADLEDPDLLIGLCTPEAPCGTLSDLILERAGIVAVIDTAEPNVRSLLGKLEAGELDAGLVYRTDVANAQGRVEAIEIGAAFNAETEYPIVALDGGAAETFVEFVLSARGAAILLDHGFAAP
jgi:molybdate transport system substrate-binding protein